MVGNICIGQSIVFLKICLGVAMKEIYKEIFQNSYDGLCLIDKDGNGIVMNQAGERITGFKAEDFSKSNVKTALEEGIISNTVTLKVIEKKRIFTDVVSIRGREVLITGTPIIDENGEVQFVVLNVRDISELNFLPIDQLLSIALKRKKISKGKETYNQNPPELVLDGVVAESKSMKEILKLVAKVSKVNSTVLLLGESGVGKEVIAKLIHRNSPHRDKPLVSINCAAIPEHLLETELFGYEKGAFTGADSKGKPGLFEIADGGTIFLDEIGEMSLDLQVKLLRTLQEFEVRRIGGRKSMKINVRVICATNKDLEKLVREGKFREDLYYRLNVIPIVIPPLREIIEDIAPLAYKFLNKANKKYHLKKYFQPGVIYLMEQYDWPGNVRQMENMIERLVVISEHDEISWSDLPFLSAQKRLTEHFSLKYILQEVEKKIILEKMETYQSTRKAAKALGISQSSLVQKLKKYRMDYGEKTSL